MNEQLLNVVVTLTTSLGIPGLFVIFWLWERKRTQTVVDRHLEEQKRQYDLWLKEQRELYERYLEDLREWAGLRDRRHIRYSSAEMIQPGGSEMRPLPTVSPSPGD